MDGFAQRHVVELGRHQLLTKARAISTDYSARRKEITQAGRGSTRVDGHTRSRTCTHGRAKEEPVRMYQVQGRVLLGQLGSVRLVVHGRSAVLHRETGKPWRPKVGRRLIPRYAVHSCIPACSCLCCAPISVRFHCLHAALPFCHVFAWVPRSGYLGLACTQ